MKSHFKFDYDALIIGSGFGGSITAQQLSSKLKVGLIERGPWRDTLPAQSMGIKHRSPLPQNQHFYTHFLRSIDAKMGSRLPLPELTLNRNGMYEVFYDRKLLLVNASGVGGGSHAYTALHHRPRNKDYWQSISKDISPQEMELHYKKFLKTMGSKKPDARSKIPNHTRTLYQNPSHLIVKDSTWQPYMGLLFNKPSSSGQHHSNRIIDPKSECVRMTSNYQNEGLLGSFTGSKTTLDIAYLFSAMAEGLTIHDCTQAWTIVKNAPAAKRRYRIDCYNHRHKTFQYFHCDHLFLAAGTLNTLKLLFKSRDDAKTLSGMSYLGERFATNADSVSFWLRSLNDADFTQGMPCHGPIDFHDNEDRAQFIQAGISGLESIPLPKSLKKRLTQSLFLIAMAEDSNSGKASWHRKRLSIEYSLKDQKIYRHIQA